MGSGGALVAMSYPGYVLAGYAVVAAGLGGYVVHLLFRGRRAKARASAIAAKRDGLRAR